MVFDGDPYRTLGLARGASLDEVKRAYRRLAKANHPDAAGAGALARFLAIQAAYERLAGGPGGSGRSETETRDPGSAPRRPAEADPDRADATRRAYGGRPRGRRHPPEGERERPAGSGRARDNGPGGPHGKATLGSTSYDGADASPFEPDWGGASWYGTTSGTYWTINPKEYADPRKHGPEYQARARRAASARRGDGGSGPEAHGPTSREDTGGSPARAPGATATAEDLPDGPDSPGRGTGTSGPTHTTASWWDSTFGAAQQPGERAGPTAAHRPADETRFPEGSVPDPARAAAELVRALTDPRAGGIRGRILRAFVGWLPIAFGLGWLFGELTGCGRFAASCDASADPAILAIQGAALIALILVPDLGSLAAAATLGLLVASVAAALLLSATGTAADEGSRRATLSVLLLVAWFAGLIIAVAQHRGSPSSGAGPVS